VDLLQHEALVAVLLGSVLVPVDLVNVALDGPALRVDEAGALGGHGHDLAVLHELHVAGLREEGRDRGSDEALAVAHAHHQRALLAGAHEHLRLVGRHRHEGVVAAKVVVREPHRLHEVALEVVGDQVGHHLGVGLGGEVRAVGEQPVAEVGPVLDDPVEHDVHALGGVPVRVGVRLGHAAVGGPARVAYPGGAAQVPVLRHHRVAEVLKVAHGVNGVDRPVRDEGEPCRVVPAVLESLQTLKKEVAALARSDVTDDAAHESSRLVQKFLSSQFPREPYANRLGPQPTFDQ
jgi:hypothetical protein